MLSYSDKGGKRRLTGCRCADGSVEPEVDESLSLLRYPCNGCVGNGVERHGCGGWPLIARTGVPRRDITSVHR